MRIRFSSVVILWSVLIAAPALSATKQEQRVADATDVIDQLLRIPEQTIPPALLDSAYAIAVIPSMVKVGFGVGGRFGKGVLVVRKDDNSWSNPAFINLTAGSFGWQIGAQAADIVLVFKNKSSVVGFECVSGAARPAQPMWLTSPAVYGPCCPMCSRSS